MASSAGRAKRDREKQRQERQALKREKRLAGPQVSEDDAGEPGVVVAIPQDEVLTRLAALHLQFENEQIGFDDFEEAKAELLKHLDI